ncbi:hypothetical protein V6Z12_D11G362200 [Gossypium hirsutum]
MAATYPIDKRDMSCKVSWKDKLLAYWLLSTISSPLLSCFTSAQSVCDIWSIANLMLDNECLKC